MTARNLRSSSSTTPSVRQLATKVAFASACASVDEITATLNNIKVNDEKLAFISKSQKGGPVLYFLGYYYRNSQKPSSVGVMTWRCCSTYCTASCTTTGNNIGSQYEFTAKNATHQLSCRPDVIKIAQLESSRLVKLAAIHSTDLATRHILDAVVAAKASMSDEQAAHAPSNDAMRQKIYRARRAYVAKLPANN